MLEAAGPSSQTADNDDRIYAGTYYVIKNPGNPKHPFRLVQIDKSKVAETFGAIPNGRSEINIHVGNSPRNILGCMSPGLKWDDMGSYPTVSKSGPVLDDLTKLIKKSKTRNDVTTYDGQKWPYEKQTFYEEVVVIIKDEIK